MENTSIDLIPYIDTTPYYPKIEILYDNGFLVLKTKLRKQDKNGIWYHFIVKENHLNVSKEDIYKPVNLFHAKCYQHLVLHVVDSNMNDLAINSHYRTLLYYQEESQISEYDRLMNLIPKPTDNGTDNTN